MGKDEVPLPQSHACGCRQSSCDSHRPSLLGRRDSRPPPEAAAAVDVDDDRLHQPYRASLCPLLPALKKLPLESGLLGVALSGAGPSVLIFLDSKGSCALAKSRVAAHLRKCGLAAELISTEITGRGARDADGWKTSRITKLA